MEVYDGTVYFANVWFRDRGVRAVLEEVEEALRSGYLGVKLKAGRGSKWMERDAGLARVKMSPAGMRTLVADGESARAPEDLAPYLAPRWLVDVVQYDVRAGGFLDNARMARMAGAAGGASVPHNWASNIALFAGLQERSSSAAGMLPMRSSPKGTDFRAAATACPTRRAWESASTRRSTRRSTRPPSA